MERDLFEKAPVPQAYLKLAVPVVLAMVLGVVYNFVDTWFISLTGDSNLVAGVSICAPVFILSIAMGDIWGLGGSSLISRLLGEKKDAEAAGAALATSLSNLLSCVIYLIIIITKCKVLTIDPKLARASICRIREVLRIGISASVTNIMNSLSLMITNRFLVPYGNEPAVVSIGTAILRFMQISSILMGVTLVTTCVCQAVGNAKGALILSLSRQGLIFTVSIFVLQSLFGLTGIMLAQPVSDLLTGIAAGVIVFSILQDNKRRVNTFGI